MSISKFGSISILGLKVATASTLNMHRLIARRRDRIRINRITSHFERCPFAVKSVPFGDTFSYFVYYSTSLGFDIAHRRSHALRTIDLSRMLAVICLFGSVLAFGAQPNLLLNLDKEWTSGDKWHGVAIVRIGGKVRLSSAHGYAVREFGIPNTVTTRFKLFSVSKQFTAMAAMQLVEQGRLDLKAPITEYLSGLPKSWNSITMMELLQHTAGVPQSFEQTWMEQWEADDATDLLSNLKRVQSRLPDLEFTPGSQWRYSNMGYIIAGCVVEAVSREPFNRFVQE
jgi:hypothetical protein